MFINWRQSFGIEKLIAYHFYAKLSILNLLSFLHVLNKFVHPVLMKRIESNFSGQLLVHHKMLWRFLRRLQNILRYFTAAWKHFGVKVSSNCNTLCKSRDIPVVWKVGIKGVCQVNALLIIIKAKIIPYLHRLPCFSQMFQKYYFSISGINLDINQK